MWRIWDAYHKQIPLRTPTALIETAVCDSVQPTGEIYVSRYYSTNAQGAERDEEYDATVPSFSKPSAGCGTKIKQILSAQTSRDMTLIVTRVNFPAYNTCCCTIKSCIPASGGHHSSGYTRGEQDVPAKGSLRARCFYSRYTNLALDTRKSVETWVVRTTTGLVLALVNEPSRQ